MRVNTKAALDAFEEEIASLPSVVLGKSTSKVTTQLEDLLNILRRLANGVPIATLFDIPDDESWPVDPAILLSVIIGEQTANEAAYDAILTHYDIKSEEDIVFSENEDVVLSLLSLEQEVSWNGTVHIERPMGDTRYDELTVYGYAEGEFDTIVITGGFWRGQVHFHHTTTERPDGSNFGLGEIGYIVLSEGRYLADYDFWQRYFFPTDWLVPYLSRARVNLCRPLEILCKWVPDPADLPIIGGVIQGHLNDEGRLPWYEELVLSVVFEPADWYFTALDLKEGRCAEVLAAGGIGLILPLIPGSVGRFGASIKNNVPWRKAARELGPEVTEQLMEKTIREGIPSIERQIDEIVGEVGASDAIKVRVRRHILDDIELNRSSLDDLAITASEGLDKTEKIREELAAVGSAVSEKRNVAYAECYIDGEYFELASASGNAMRPGMVDVPQTRMFDVFDVGHPRNVDAEVKILEEIASKLPKDASGEIYLFSELEFCVSCAGVISQFQNEFPNIRIVGSYARPNN